MIDYSKYYIDEEGDVFVFCDGIRKHTLIFNNLVLYDDAGNMIEYMQTIFNGSLKPVLAHCLLHIGI